MKGNVSPQCQPWRVDQMVVVVVHIQHRRWKKMLKRWSMHEYTSNDAEHHGHCSHTLRPKLWVAHWILSNTELQQTYCLWCTRLPYYYCTGTPRAAVPSVGFAFSDAAQLFCIVGRFSPKKDTSNLHNMHYMLQIHYFSSLYVLRDITMSLTLHISH